MGEKEISRILITGGNGFIGSHLAEKLLARGDTVSLLDLKFSANTRFLDCEKIRGDIRDYQTVREAVDGKDAVINLAAVSRVAWGQQDPFNCWLTNQVGTINVLEASNKAASNPVLLEASSREGDGSMFGEDFHFVTGRGVSVSELARMIVDLVGSRSKIIHGAANSFEVRKFVGDLTKARKVLGYEPKTRLEDGLKRLSERMVPIIIAK